MNAESASILNAEYASILNAVMVVSF